MVLENYRGYKLKRMISKLDHPTTGLSRRMMGAKKRISVPKKRMYKNTNKESDKIYS